MTYKINDKVVYTGEEYAHVLGTDGRKYLVVCGVSDEGEYILVNDNWHNSLDFRPYVEYGPPSNEPNCLAPPTTDVKDTNPKTAAATNRLDLSVIPDTSIIYEALAWTEGALKYGAFNYREKGVSVSTYVAASRRHLAKYYNGEWADEKTGVPHLASAKACIGAIIDAHECGMLNDDRPPKCDVAALLEGMEKAVAHLHKIFPNPVPRVTEKGMNRDE